MAEFLVGCNYWASHAGCFMWQQWDESVVREDMATLAKGGMNCLRVFPLWPDFQPVIPVYGGGGSLLDYTMTDGSRPQNPWYLDEEMLHRFEVLCDIAHEHGIKLVVGLLTGWMSGRLFVPAVLNGVDLIAHPRALLWEQRFIEGFVTRMKHHPAIWAWDHGNECGCLWRTSDRDAAASWTTLISHAIRVADNTRPVITGIHDLSLNGVWNIRDQAAATDMLVTHPYPFWVPHAGGHALHAMKTLVHAAAQTAFYADIAQKPCLVEEIGTMGPMICSDETAADFMRLNLLHAHIYNRPGLMWWTGFDIPLNLPPYRQFACERELGLFTADRKPKGFMKEMTATVERLKALPSLPDVHVDAVCILTRGIDAWKIAFATYMLAVQAGIHVSFADGEQPLPPAKAYLLPAVSGAVNLDKDRYDELKARVRDGAKLYLSLCDGILSEFEELTGLVIDDSAGGFTCTFDLDGVPISGHGDRQLILRDTPNGLHRHRYGHGTVYALDFSPEAHLFDSDTPEESPYYHIYRHVFHEERAAYPIQSDDPTLGIVWHEQSGFCSVINYSDQPKTLAGHTIPPFDAAIIKL